MATLKKHTTPKKRSTKKIVAPSSSLDISAFDGAFLNGISINQYQATYNPSTNSGTVILYLSNGQRPQYNVDATKLSAILMMLLHQNKIFQANFIAVTG